MYRLLHNIGESPSEAPHIKSNYNTIEEVLSAEGILTFDGIYKNVYEQKENLHDIILFVMGDYVGADNSFDTGMPLEHYCTWEEIEEMEEECNAEIAWHTWSHPDLTTVSDEQLKKEVTPPFKMKKFAYPYGRYNERVIKAVKDAGFEEAYSVVATDGTKWTIPRSYI